MLWKQEKQSRIQSGIIQNMCLLRKQGKQSWIQSGITQNMCRPWKNIFPNRTDDTFAVNDNAASECDDDDDDGPLNHRWDVIRSLKDSP